MENRNKFFTNGEWCSDTLKERYDHIKDVLDVYNKINNKGKRGIDLDDLKYIIKNAFVSKIYISVKAKKILDKNYPDEKRWKLRGLYKRLIKDGELDLQKKYENINLSPFEICRVCDKGLKLRIEHVVPGKVYIDYVIDLSDPQTEGEFNFEEFDEIFKNVYICIVTEDEAKELDKDLRDCMPVEDFKKDPFARYEKKGIAIYWPSCQCERI